MYIYTMGMIQNNTNLTQTIKNQTVMKNSVKKIVVTEKEGIVLQGLADLMYAEYNYSDVSPKDLSESTGINMRSMSGLLGSLTNKGYVSVDDRECEGYKNRTDMHIVYLWGGAEGLFDEWVESGEVEIKAELVIKK